MNKGERKQNKTKNYYESAFNISSLNLLQSLLVSLISKTVPQSSYTIQPYPYTLPFITRRTLN